MGTQKDIRKHLLAAQKAVSSALAALNLIEEEPQGYAIGSCVWCGKPITESDETVRGRHKACYNEIYAEFLKPLPKEKRAAETERLVAEGMLDAPAKSGRKPANLQEKALAARRRIDERNKEK